MILHRVATWRAPWWKAAPAVCAPTSNNWMPCLRPTWRGTNPASITLCGGMSRSAVFGQLLANIAAREVVVPQTHQTSALGAAICAAVATGDYPDFASACQALCHVRTRFSAQQEHAAVNGQLYATWSRFREQAEISTVPIAVDHLLPRVLKEPEHALSSAAAPTGLHALVSASFDAGSLDRLRNHMDVQYASFREVKRLLTGPDLVKALQGKQIFVTEVDVVDANALRQLPDLRVVAACRGDAVNVDVEACTAFGIPVLFAPGRNAVAVADLAVAFMINLARKLPAAIAVPAPGGLHGGQYEQDGAGVQPVAGPRTVAQDHRPGGTGRRGSRRRQTPRRF